MRHKREGWASQIGVSWWPVVGIQRRKNGPGQFLDPGLNFFLDNYSQVPTAEVRRKPRGGAH